MHAVFFPRQADFSEIELTPAGYVFAQICYLFITYRISLYNVADTAAETMVQTGDTCFITFDTRFNYLGSNSTAKKIFPELRNLIVDLACGTAEPCSREFFPGWNNTGIIRRMWKRTAISYPTATKSICSPYNPYPPAGA